MPHQAVILLEFLPGFGVVFFHPVDQAAHPAVHSGHCGVVFLGHSLQDLLAHGQLPLCAAYDLQRGGQIFTVHIRLQDAPLRIKLLAERQHPEDADVRGAAQIQQQIQQAAALRQVLPAVRPQERCRGIAVPVIPLQQQQRAVMQAVEPLEELIPIHILQLARKHHDIHTALLAQLPQQLLAAVETDTADRRILLLQIIFPDADLPLVVAQKRDMQL